MLNKSFFPEFFDPQLQPINFDKKAARETIESEISLTLQKNSSLTAAAKSLIETWLNKNLSAAEIEIICRFLYCAGFHRQSTLFQLQLLQQKKNVNWYFFAASLYKSGLNINEEIWTAVVRGASEQNQLSPLTRLNFLTKHIADFEVLKAQEQATYTNMVKSLRRSLWENFEFFNSQRVLSEADSALSELLRIFPNDNEAKVHKVDLHHRQLLAQIDQRPQHKRTRASLISTQDLDYSNQQKSILAESIFKTAESQPELLEDLIINSIMTENYEAAGILLDRTQQHDEKWILWRIEVCLLARRFAEALSWVENFEQSFSGQAEFHAQLELQYLKAQAQWGLEQKFAALEIIESIVQVQPNFRNAQALVAEWKEDLA